MQTFHFQELGDIPFYSREEVLAPSFNEPNHELLRKWFDICDMNERLLNIWCPYIALTPGILTRNITAKTTAQVFVTSYISDKLPDPKRNLLLIRYKSNLPIWLQLGALCHEMRHFYQNRFHPEVARTQDTGYRTSLYSDAEVDADGYAIACMVRCFDFELLQAAELFCPYKLQYPEAFDMRLDAARVFLLGFPEIEYSVTRSDKIALWKIRTDRKIQQRRQNRH